MASETEVPEFAHTDLLPLLEDPYDTTEFRHLTADGRTRRPLLPGS